MVFVQTLVRRKLKELPANTAKFRGCTVDEIINKRSANEKTFSEKTINDHLELYNRLFSWSRREVPDYKNDPFFEIRVQATKKEKANKKRESFNRDELEKIFSTDLYVNHGYESPYQFWTPLIALYTGARRAEIAALYKKDVYQIDNIWVFDFNENSTDKRVKTLNGIRRTPIHPHLVELGFLTYHASGNNDSRLFTDLDHYTEKEGYGRKIGDWFNRDYLKKLGIYVKIKKVFYSFRHTLTSELERAGVTDSMIEQICGREAKDKTIGREVYTDDAELPRLLNEIIKIDFRQELSAVKKWTVGR